MRVKTLRNVHFCSKYLVQTFMTLIWYFIFAWIRIVAFICIKRVCRGNCCMGSMSNKKKNSRFSNFFALTQLVALFLLLRSLVQSLGVKARESFWTPTIKMPYLIHLLVAVLIPWIFLFIIRHWGNLVPPKPTSLFSWNKNKSCCRNLIKWRVFFGTGPPWNRDQVWSCLCKSLKIILW